MYNCLKIIVITLMAYSIVLLSGGSSRGQEIDIDYITRDTNNNDIPDACESGMADYDPTDLDDDGNLNDSCEEALAWKFAPVIHKDPRDHQEGLSKPEDLYIDNRAEIRYFGFGGSGSYTLSGAESFHPDPLPQLTYTDDEGGTHTISVDPMNTGIGWRIDIADWYRGSLNPDPEDLHPGSFFPERHLFYHIYRGQSDGDQSDKIYVQYWMFWTMNDISEDEDVGFQDPDPYHEGDWEVVTIELDNASYQPSYVKFSQHEGYWTEPSGNCLWSSDHDKLLLNIQQGYNTEHTHLHVWVSRNSHALYNAGNNGMDMYEVDVDIYLRHVLGNIRKVEDLYTYADATDYEYGYMFAYDNLINLGECEFRNELPPGHEGLAYSGNHAFLTEGMSPSWLGFAGRFGSEYDKGSPPKNPALQANWRQFQYNRHQPDVDTPFLVNLANWANLLLPFFYLPNGFGFRIDIEIKQKNWEAKAYDGPYNTYTETWSEETRIMQDYTIPTYHHVSVSSNSEIHVDPDLHLEAPLGATLLFNENTRLELAHDAMFSSIGEVDISDLLLENSASWVVGSSTNSVKDIELGDNAGIFIEPDSRLTIKNGGTVIADPNSHIDVYGELIIEEGVDLSESLLFNLYSGGQLTLSSDDSIHFNNGGGIHVNGNGLGHEQSISGNVNLSFGEDGVFEIEEGLLTMPDNTRLFFAEESEINLSASLELGNNAHINLGAGSNWSGNPTESLVLGDHAHITANSDVVFSSKISVGDHSQLTFGSNSAVSFRGYSNQSNTVGSYSNITLGPNGALSFHGDVIIGSHTEISLAANSEMSASGEFLVIGSNSDIIFGDGLESNPSQFNISGSTVFGDGSTIIFGDYGRFHVANGAEVSVGENSAISFGDNGQFNVAEGGEVRVGQMYEENPFSFSFGDNGEMNLYNFTHHEEFYLSFGADCVFNVHESASLLIKGSGPFGSGMELYVNAGASAQIRDFTDNAVIPLSNGFHVSSGEFLVRRSDISFSDQSDFYANDGSDVHILEGSIFRFGSQSGFVVDFSGHGDAPDISMVGNMAHPIIFTSNTPEAGSWSGIEIFTIDEINLSYTTIAYADTGLKLKGVLSSNNKFDLDNCLIHSNRIGCEFIDFFESPPENINDFENYLDSIGSISESSIYGNDEFGFILNNSAVLIECSNVSNSVMILATNI